MLRIDTSIEKLVHFDTNFLKGNPYLCDLKEKLCQYMKPMLEKGVYLHNQYSFIIANSEKLLEDQHSKLETGLMQFPLEGVWRYDLTLYDVFLESLLVSKTDQVFLEANELRRQADSVFTLGAFFLISLGSPYHEIDHYLPSGHFYIVVRDGMHYKGYWDPRAYLEKTGNKTEDRTPVFMGEWSPTTLTPHSPGFGKSKDL